MPSAPPKRERVLSDPLPRLRPFLATDLSLAGGRSGLIDLLVTGGRVRGAHRDVGADLLELELIRGGGVLQDGEHVLRVTGVPNTLDVRTLGRVATLLGGREVLTDLGAL